MANVSIDAVHTLVYSIAAKQIAAFPSPAEFNEYANLANIDLFNYYNDEREKLLVKVKQGEKIFVPPVLSTFVQYNVVLGQSGNVLTQPDDYLYDLQLTSASTTLYTKVDYDKVANYLNSTIDAPTTDNPIYVELPDTFEIYPTLTNNHLTYLGQPPAVLWNYSLVNGRPVYNPTGTLDFGWQGTEIYRLSARILKYMSISIKDDELMQAAQQMEQGAS